MGKIPKGFIAKYNESLSLDQYEAKKVINKHIISCITGNPGVGKTYLAINYALEQMALDKKRADIEGLIITRPIVYDKDKELGFLPGDLWEKMGPFLEPMTSIMIEFLGKEVFDSFVNDGTINIAPLMAIQGRTFYKKICIVDEAENLTYQDVKDLFTRIGKGSKMIFSGDMNQCKLKKAEESGFPKLCELTAKSNNVSTFNLTTNYRSEIVEELLALY